MRYVIVLVISFFAGSGHSQDLISAATTFLNEKNYVEAKTAIDDAFLKPDAVNNPRAWYTKGRVYHEILKSNDPGLAKIKENPEQLVNTIIEAYDKTKTLSGENTNLFILANNHMEKLWAHAINDGYTHYQAQNFPAAIQSFDHAKLVKPQDTLGYLYAGVSSQMAGRYQEAIDNYLAIKRIQPLSRSIYDYIISCKTAQRSGPDEMLDVLEEALVYYPNYIPYVLREIQILTNQKKYEEAESRLKTVIARNPKDADLRLYQADLFDRIFKDAYVNGKPERSIRYFDLASQDYEFYIESYPNDFLANFNYAVMINERANRFYVSANLLNDEEYQIRGNEIEEEGHSWTKKALPFMERARSLKPDDEGVIKALRSFYQRLKLDEKLAQLNNK